MKVCAVVLGIPLLTGIVGIFSATIDGTIMCMPLYKAMKKLERVDVACTELLGASESFTFHQENTRKEQALEIVRVDLPQDRCCKSIASFVAQMTGKKLARSAPTSVTRAAGCVCVCAGVSIRTSSMQALPRVARNQLGAGFRCRLASHGTVNEVGMLGCAMDPSSSLCILNGPTPVVQCPYYVRPCA